MFVHKHGLGLEVLSLEFGPRLIVGSGAEVVQHVSPLDPFVLHMLD